MLQELLACRRLEGGKAKDPLFILADGEVDHTVTEIADTIE